MNPTDEALLDKKILELSNAINLGKLIPFLLKNEIYDNESLQMDIGIGSPTEQTRRMILGIKKKGQLAFINFINCLVEAEMFEAAHILRPDEIKVPIPPLSKSREKAGEDLLIDLMSMI